MNPESESESESEQSPVPLSSRTETTRSPLVVLATDDADDAVGVCSIDGECSR